MKTETFLHCWRVAHIAYELSKANKVGYENDAACIQGGLFHDIRKKKTDYFGRV